MKGREPILLRLGRQWRLKLVLLVALPVLFCAGYFSLQHFTLRPPVTFEWSVIDRAIDFEPGWVYVYQSLYLLLPLPPLAATHRAQLVRYAAGFTVLAAAGFAIFLAYPVLSPRPEGATGVFAFDLLARYEGRLNAFPSLHAGLAVHALLFTRWAYPLELRTGRGRGLFALALAWTAAIFYSTLATKQHYAVDLVAGTALAFLAHLSSGKLIPNKELTP